MVLWYNHWVEMVLLYNHFKLVWFYQITSVYRFWLVVISLGKMWFSLINTQTMENVLLSWSKYIFLYKRRPIHAMLFFIKSDGHDFLVDILAACVNKVQQDVWELLGFSSAFSKFQFEWILMIDLKFGTRIDQHIDLKIVSAIFFILEIFLFF